MKKILSVFLLFVALQAGAQNNTRPYPVAVNFQSLCCGVPSDSILFKTIRSFKTQQHIKKKLAYDRIGPLGKEGEYALAFRLTELTAKQKRLFIAALNKVALKMTDRGTASVSTDFDASAVSSRAVVEKKRI